MFNPIVRRVVAVALAAPALVVGTAVAATASEQPAGHTHFDSTGAGANALGAQTSQLGAGSAWHGRDMSIWYHARTADAGAQGANASTVDAAAHRSGGHGWGHGHGAGSVGFNQTSAHAGADGASAGDIDAGAAFRH
jgi:hypothetical protein